MAEDNKMKRCPVTLQPDIEELLDWNHYSADDFDSASQTEKKDFIQERQSVSYWKDAWRRLKKNVVAMVALGVIIFLVLFAFVGPYLVPYGYDQFNKGAENLHPTLRTFIPITTHWRTPRDWMRNWQPEPPPVEPRAQKR